MEVLEHERNGIVVDFYDHMNIADWVDKIFAHPTRMKHLGKAARETILDTYSLKKLLPLHLKLINDVAAGKNPPPAAKEIAAMNPIPDYMFMKK
jgi:glycosyltransferase involved in cell wall biosynthesis